MDSRKSGERDQSLEDQLAMAEAESIDGLYQDGEDEAAGELSAAEQAALDAEGPKRKLRAVIGNRAALTAQQQAFVRGVIEGKSQRQAFRDAYPNSKAADSTVSAAAGRLMRHPVIQAMIEEAWNETREALVEDQVRVKRYVLGQLLTLSKSGKQEGTRLKALELMARSVGMFRDQEPEQAPAPSAADLKKELAGHLQRLK